MSGRDYYDRRRMIEQRIVSKRNANLDSRQFLESLVEEQYVIMISARRVERLAPGSCPFDLIATLSEHAFQRTTQPFVTTSNQRGSFERFLLRHDLVWTKGKPLP